MVPWTLLQILTALASALAAFALWRLRSRLERPVEPAAALLQARSAEVAALTRELEALRELTPIRIRDYLLAAREDLQRFRTAVEEGYRSARDEIERCNAEISGHQDRGEWRAQEIAELVNRREALLEMVNGMRPDLGELRHQCDFPETIGLRLARMAPEAIQALAQGYRALADQLPLRRTEEVLALADRVVPNLQYRLDASTLFSGALFARETGDPAEIWQRPDSGD